MEGTHTSDENVPPIDVETWYKHLVKKGKEDSQHYNDDMRDKSFDRNRTSKPSVDTTTQNPRRNGTPPNMENYNGTHNGTGGESNIPGRQPT